VLSSAVTSVLRRGHVTEHVRDLSPRLLQRLCALWYRQRWSFAADAQLTRVALAQGTALMMLPVQSSTDEGWAVHVSEQLGRGTSLDGQLLAWSCDQRYANSE
jgi:hypothetical protein